MVISPYTKNVLLFLIGAVLLTLAFLMARIFWGAQLSLAIFSLFSTPPKNIASYLILILPAPIITALPFGFLFGFIHPPHKWTHATLFALLAAASLICFAVWVSISHHPMPITHPSWMFIAFESIVFVGLFPFFANLGARVGLPNTRLRTRLGAVMFVVLALCYYFGFDVYYEYIYTSTESMRYWQKSIA